MDNIRARLDINFWRMNMMRQAKTCTILKTRPFRKVFGLSEFQTKLRILCGERVRIRFPPNWIYWGELSSLIPNVIGAKVRQNHHCMLYGFVMSWTRFGHRLQNGIFKAPGSLQTIKNYYHGFWPTTRTWNSLLWQLSPSGTKEIK